MRSRGDYIVTKDDVYGYACEWLGTALRLEYEGTKCNASMLLHVLLIAASRVVSIFAACRDLADAPTDQTINNALAASLPEIAELERRLNRSLGTKLPKGLWRRARPVAIDMTLIPYHGEPDSDPREIVRGQPKSGTTHFHAYGTAVIVHKGHRYTLALTRVEQGESMKVVVQRLLEIVRKRKLKIKLVLLDKGFFNVAVLSYLKRARHAFIVPAVPRGRKPADPRKAKGLRALLGKRNGYYPHTLTGNIDGKQHSVELTICAASKTYQHRKSGERRCKKQLYAVRGFRRSPSEIRELYRLRFGIETSYRQMNEARIKTTTRDPKRRLLFVGIALIMRNVWVWLHYHLAKRSAGQAPELHLELLRFSELLLWITQSVQRLLGATRTQGINVETYNRVTARRSAA
jgi:hypothetical protein